MKRRVQLCQVNSTYGRNAFLAYSVGCLQAYAQAQPDIREAYEFAPLLFLREDPVALAERIPQPDILGCSSYIWNEGWNLAFAKAVKERYPECLVIFGGPQVPERTASEYLQEHPFLSILVHGEGEVVFTELLKKIADGGGRLMSIPGLTYRGGTLNQPICSGPPARISDLSVLPSPYLAGVFDEMPFDHYSLHATQETHRGCPAACAMCDWGSLIFAKVKAFSDERIDAEYEWCAQRKIELLYNADANYGLLPRDGAMNDRLIATKEKYGYPQQLRAAWTKNANQKVFDMASKLNAAGMAKGVTLALQSLDPNTLEIIKRKNISMEDFEKWVKRYHDAGVGTYTELILGLPGETYDTFADGIDRVLRAGQHHGLYIYLCQALPNSELSDPGYITTHGIETVRCPLLQQHVTPDPTAQEYADIVIATKTMPREDWLRAYMFAWAVMTFHCLGISTKEAIEEHARHGTSYRTIYEGLLGASIDRPTPIHPEFLRILALAQAGMQGGPWGEVVPGFGDVLWPYEEASFLRLSEYAPITPNDPPFHGDKERYGRELVWQGRKSWAQAKENIRL